MKVKKLFTKIFDNISNLPILNKLYDNNLTNVRETDSKGLQDAIIFNEDKCLIMIKSYQI